MVRGGKLEDLIGLLVREGSSDLHLKVGSPPVTRVQGLLRSPCWWRKKGGDVADPSYLRKVATAELDRAIDLLDRLSNEDLSTREMIVMTQRDVVGKNDPNLCIAVLAGEY